MEQEADISIDQICWLFCVDFLEKIIVKKFQGLWQSIFPEMQTKLNDQYRNF